MTGDKFRARANRYIKAARAVTDPVHKLALMDVAQRWPRLAAQIDGAAIHASRNSESARNAGPVRAGPARISGDGAPIARKRRILNQTVPESWGCSQSPPRLKLVGLSPRFRGNGEQS
jgi:hypothetical protein